MTSTRDRGAAAPVMFIDFGAPRIVSRLHITAK
jgi:hypothetical protein